jgi:serine/threonine-protein kinase
MREPVAQGTSFGRYEIVHELAAGGMGTVYLGRMRAARGVGITVAIKRINRALAGDPHAMGMFVDEARITSLIRHPNVVQTIDVVEESGELLLVMEYVHGVSLGRLVTGARALGDKIPLAVASRIACDVLNGLHAAHETTNEVGASLEIVHRDVSPQNVLIGVDGIARVVDFGIARAANRIETTKAGEIKGKLRYIAPEQFEREAVDRRADIYGVGLLLWEMIAGSAMRRASSPGGLTSAILTPRVTAPSSLVPDVPAALDDVVLKALSNDPRDRFAFASQMALALEAAVTPAPYAVVAELVRELGRDEITERKALLERAAALSSGSIPAAAPSVPAVERASGPMPGAPSLPVLPAARDVKRRRSVLAGVGALAVAIVALLFLVAGHREERSPPEGAGVPAVASPEPVVLRAPDPPPPAVASASAPAAAAPPSPAPHETHSRKGVRLWPGRTKKPDCTIPYVVDKNGIRVPRRECM